MAVLRIVPDLRSDDPQALASFYARAFEMDVAMDGGFIVTMAGGEQQTTQLSLASEGGSGTELPAISVEVDDLDATLERLDAEGVTPVYGPVDEPWGVRRFYVRDPAGHLINVLVHK